MKVIAMGRSGLVGLGRSRSQGPQPRPGLRAAFDELPRAKQAQDNPRPRGLGRALIQVSELPFATLSNTSRIIADC